jgi:hypothetical protein
MTLEQIPSTVPAAVGIRNLDWPADIEKVGDFAMLKFEL